MSKGNRGPGGQELTAKTLGLLGGGELEDEINGEIRAAVSDCVSRPHIEARRRVVVVIDFTPNVGGSGVCEKAAIEAHVKHSFPARKAASTVARVSPRGSAMFSEASPEDPDQLTLGGGGEGN